MELKLIKPKVRLGNQSLSLKDYYNIRNNVIIIRKCGGVGDILIQRMLFENIKNLIPDCKIIYACPKLYHSILKDHPFIDEVIDCSEVDKKEAICIYDITTIDGKYELEKSPYIDKHRAEIYADYCGFDLKYTSMHLTLPKEAEELANNTLKKYEKPKICFCPISVQESRSLDREQVNSIIKEVIEMGYDVFTLHTNLNDGYICDQIHSTSLLQWLSVIKASDYIISVDTGSFHAAQGLGKPVVGIFSWVDGKVCGKYNDKFELVQKHRDNGNWECGPCYNWPKCPKSTSGRKPCITEITSKDVVNGFKRLVSKFSI